MITPCSAYQMAGPNRSENGKRPKRACIASMPAMKPGTNVSCPLAFAAAGFTALSPRTAARAELSGPISATGIVLGSVSLRYVL